VGYDAGRRQAWLSASTPLDPLTSYSLAIGSGIADTNGNRLSYAKWSFSTGRAVTRLAGADRYATAAAISAASFSPGVPVAYLATGASFPDALTGGAAAAKAGGPVLLTTLSGLPAATAAELGRLKPGRIVVLGGAGVISNAQLSSLAAYTSGGVTRLAGADRYATAAAISAASYPADGPATVYLATGATFPDGLAGAPVAGRASAPLLLTMPTSLPAAVADELRRLNPSRVVVLGASGAVSDGVLAAVRSLWD
jgi:putative cell wall-binding protein